MDSNSVLFGEDTHTSVLSPPFHDMPDWFSIENSDSDNIEDALDGIRLYNNYIEKIGIDPQIFKINYLYLELPGSDLDIDFDQFFDREIETPMVKKFKIKRKPKHLVSKSKVQSGRIDLEDHDAHKTNNSKHVTFRDVLNSGLKPQQILRSTPPPIKKNGCTYSLGVFSFNKTSEFCDCDISVRNLFSSNYKNMLHITKNKYNTFKALSLECLNLLETKHQHQDYFDVGEIDERYKEFGFDRVVLNMILDKLSVKDRNQRSLHRNKIRTQARIVKANKNSIAIQGITSLIPPDFNLTGMLDSIKDIISSSFEIVKKKVEEIMRSLLRHTVKSSIVELWDSYKWWLVCLLVSIPVVKYIYDTGKEIIGNNLVSFKKIIKDFISSYLPDKLCEISDLIVSLFTWPFANSDKRNDDFWDNVIPQSDYSPPKEEYSSHPFVNTIMLALVGFTRNITNFKNFSISPKAISNILKFIGHVPSYKKGIDTICEWIITFLEKVINYFRYYVLGKTDYVILRKVMPIYDNWRKDVFGTYNSYLLGNLPVNLDSKSIIDDLYVRGRDLSSRKDVIETDTNLKSMIPPLMKMVEEMKNRMNPISPEANNVKFEPLCICLQGKSGVGKSAMTVPLLNELIVRLSAKDISRSLLEHQSAYIYSRNAEQEYWDGYYNQFACVYDDFLQKVDIAGGTSEALEIIKAVNEYQYALHSASIEDKGNVFFTSKIVLCTTNDANLQSATIKEPEALKRRFHFMVEVVPAPEYAVRSKNGQHSVLDVDKLNKCGTGFITKAIMLRVSSGTHSSHNDEKLMSYEEFVDTCVAQYRILQAKNVQRLVDVKTRIEKALFSRTNNCDYNTRVLEVVKTNKDLANIVCNSQSNIRVLDMIDHSTVDNELDDGTDEFKEGVNRDKMCLKMPDTKDEAMLSMDDMCEEESAYDTGEDDEESDDMSNIVNIIADKYKKHSIHFGSDLNNTPKKMLLSHFYRTMINVGACIHICPRNLSVVALEREPELIAEIAIVCKTVFSLVDYMSMLKKKPVDIDIFCQCLNSGKMAKVFEQLKHVTTKEPFNMASRMLNDTLFDPLMVKALCKMYERALETEENKTQSNKPLKFLRECQIGIKKIFDDIDLRYDSLSEEIGWNKYLLIFTDAIIIIGAGKLFFKGMQAIFSKPQPKEVQNSANGSSNESSVNSSVHKSMNSWRNSMRSSKRVSIQASVGYDSNMFELGKKVYLNNTYDFLVPDDNGKLSCLGKILFVGGCNAIMPLHFASAVSAAIKNGDLEWMDSLYIRQTDTETLISFPASVVDRTRFEILPNSRDWCMVNFGKILTSKPNLLKHFISNHDRSRLDNNNVAVWLGRGEWKNIPMAKCSTIENVPTSVKQNYVVNFQKLIAYDIHTIEGDCGSLITVSNPSFNNKIVGIHVSGNSTTTGYGQTITCEELQLVMHNLKIKLFGESIVPQYGHAKYEIEEIRIQSCNNSNSIVEIEREHFNTPINEKTKLHRTKLEDIYTFEGDRAALIPFKNDQGCWINPYDVALSKYCETRHWNPDYGCLDVACSDAAKHVLKGIIPAGSEIRPQVVSFEQAVCGEPGLPFFDSIVRGTSPGYPYNTSSCNMGSKGKFGIFGSKQQFDLNTPMAMTLKQEVNDYIAHASRGDTYCVYYTDSLKDEIRSMAKVREGRTRLVSGSPLVLTIVTRMYFMQVCRFIYTNRIANGVAVGSNPLGNDWNILFNLLSNCSSDNVFSGDFKNFDGSERPYILDKCGSMLTSWYGLPEDHVDTAVRMTIISDLFNSVHIRGSRMYVWDGSLASGNPLTSVINSMYNQVAFRYVWECLRVDIKSGNLGPSQDIGFFDNSVYLCTYGDDNIMSVREEMSALFTPEVIKYKMKDLGLTLTSSDKEATGCLGFDDIYEVDFLKRCFSYNKNGKVIGALPLDSIFKPLIWVKKGAPEFSRIMESLDGVKIELSAHGKSVYNSWLEIIISFIFDKYGEVVPFESYDSICSRY